MPCSTKAPPFVGRISRPRLAIWQYNEESVRVLFSNKVGDSLQDRILELLAAESLTKSEFYKHLAKPAAEIDAALDYLKSIGRIREVTIKRSGAGRPAKRWERVEGESP